MKTFVVTGTDTDVGKTVVAAILTVALDGLYWKPIQCGIEGGADREKVAAFGGQVLPEACRLHAPLSPHRAAELQNVAIDWSALALPRNIPADKTLIVEGAGGVMVPVSRRLLQIELFAHWHAPVILVARTALGTINHSLLSLEALRLWRVPVHGIIFVGDENGDSERTITEMGLVKHLGRLPILSSLNEAALRESFSKHFRRGDFALG